MLLPERAFFCLFARRKTRSSAKAESKRALFLMREAARLMFITKPAAMA